jgi:hypothetical protein
VAAHHIIILDIILDTDHFLNLYLRLNSWIQIMILNHALQASFVDLFLSLIKSILVLLVTPFLTLDSLFSQARISTLLFLLLLCCISSLSKRAYGIAPASSSLGVFATALLSLGLFGGGSISTMSHHNKMLAVDELCCSHYLQQLEPEASFVPPTAAALPSAGGRCFFPLWSCG